MLSCKNVLVGTYQKLLNQTLTITIKYCMVEYDWRGTLSTDLLALKQGNQDEITDDHR